MAKSATTGLICIWEPEVRGVLGFRVLGLGFRVLGLGFGVRFLGLQLQIFAFSGSVPIEFHSTTGKEQTVPKAGS